MVGRSIASALVALVMLTIGSSAEYIYEGAGPFNFTTLSGLSYNLPSSIGCGNSCSIELEVFLPPGDDVPLVIYSAGFTLPTTQYKLTADRLASYGYAVVFWSPVTEGPFRFMTHLARGKAVSSVIDWASTNVPTADSSGKVFVMGHSAGGKSSVIAASVDSRITGVLGIDAVDCPPPGQDYDSDFPASVDLMESTSARYAFVGSELGPVPVLGMPCAPAECGFEPFYANAPSSPAWLVEVLDAGHNQFLDARPQNDICPSGDITDAVVRDLTSTIAVAWAEYTVRGVEISAYLNNWSEEQVASGVVRSESKCTTASCIGRCPTSPPEDYSACANTCSILC